MSCSSSLAGGFLLKFENCWLSQYITSPKLRINQNTDRTRRNKFQLCDTSVISAVRIQNKLNTTASPQTKMPRGKRKGVVPNASFLFLVLWNPLSKINKLSIAHSMMPICCSTVMVESIHFFCFFDKKILDNS